MNAVERRDERIKLLHLQTQIDRKSCQQCPFRSYMTMEQCKGCESYEELNNIGKALLQLVKERVGDDPEVTRSKNASLITVEKVKECMQSGLTNKQMAEEFKVSINTFKKWKERNGLTIPKRKKMAH